MHLQYCTVILLSAVKHIVLRLGQILYLSIFSPIKVNITIWIRPFIHEMCGWGLPAGRQLRVTGSPSRRTWSLNLIWNTGGKSNCWENKWKSKKDRHYNLSSTAVPKQVHMHNWFIDDICKCLWQSRKSSNRCHF